MQQKKIKSIGKRHTLFVLLSEQSAPRQAMNATAYAFQSAIWLQGHEADPIIHLRHSSVRDREREREREKLGKETLKKSKQRNIIEMKRCYWEKEIGREKEKTGWNSKPRNTTFTSTAK